MPLARPERIRYTLTDDASGSTPLELPVRRMWPAGVAVAIFFAVFASVAWVQIVAMRLQVRDVFDLMFLLFQVFWILGWSVGVFVLGALAFLLLFYRDSARIQNGRLVLVPQLGPLRIACEYDLASIRNLRIEPASGGDTVRIRFDYAAGDRGVGDSMPRRDAEALIARIEKAMPAAARAPMSSEPAAQSGNAPDPSHQAAAVAYGANRLPARPVDRRDSSTSLSALVLVAANLLPLIGVLVFGWKLADIVVLYWSESAVIAFYTVLKIAVVGKWLAPFPAVFFLGHFGGFMSLHFLFVYAFFIRGLGATGVEPPLRETLLGIFGPLWPALFALLISHGVSFVANFMARREYAGTTISTLMAQPYKRIVVMHLTIIFGGWIVMLLKTPAPALLLLVLLKTLADFRAHTREHPAEADKVQPVRSPA